MQRKPDFAAPHFLCFRFHRLYELEQLEPLVPAFFGKVESPPVVVAQRERARD
ncbi:hypothetical protein [Mumia zhuanghuii]|uniref:hypothetical protein n=1 Tax=Mumia zhuanghuii TaxID=2585211 RepID=UPI00129C5732|nr:hypothetical protein [Mumia zhuanghuii]